MAAVTFNKYLTELYPRACAEVRKSVDVPLMFSFERLVVKVMYLLEFGEMPIPDDQSGQAFRALSAKGINEARAFIACARDANFWGAYHHSRGLVELLASTHHLVREPGEQAKRLDRYTVYPFLRSLKPHLNAMEKIRKGELTQEIYERTRKLSPARVEALEERRPKMIELWGQNLIKVNKWHHPTTMSQLVRDLNQKIRLPEKVQDHDWVSNYEHFNEAVHPSPSGHYLVGGPNLPLLSVKEPAQLLAEIVSTTEAFLGALGRWDRYLVPDCRLLKRASREHDEYHQTVLAA